jgi:hypothetical protein
MTNVTRLLHKAKRLKAEKLVNRESLRFRMD